MLAGMENTERNHRPARPHEIALLDDGAYVNVVWQDGRSVILAADLLWRNCPSAAGRRRRIDGRNLVPRDDLRVRAVRPVGHYAVNIVFSDGHDRGIFPWTLLDALGARPKLWDFLICDNAAAGEAAVN